MIIKVQKWGNSLAVRLPRSIMRSMGVDSGDSVDLGYSDGEIRIRPAPTRYNLKDLVSGITEDNRHPETDWGPPAGKEAW